MFKWNDIPTAQAYDAYAKQFPMYRDTSRDLVKIAGIEAEMRVMDLACGTGMTSGAVLEALGESGHLVAVDLSLAMLSVATKNIYAENISFHHCAADEIDRLGLDAIDCIVCNSAFWQLPSDETLNAIREILAPHGQFAFNNPAFKPAEDGKQPPNLRGMMRQIAEEEFELELAPPPQHRALNFGLEAVQNLLERNGFKLDYHESIIYEQTLAAGRAFCSIPIMTEATLPNVDYDMRMKILDIVFDRLDIDPMETYSSTWDYFVVSAK